MQPLILLIDDKPEIAKVIAMFLKYWYRTDYSSNGIEALERLRSSEERPTLIVSDLNMPDMDGYELIKTLKSDQQLKDIPILILSSIESSADRIALFDLGAADFMVKPFNPEELRMRIRRIIG